MNQIERTGIKVGGFFVFTCWHDNHFAWQDRTHNLVVNAGLQHILDVTFAGGTAVSTWHLGLASSSMTIASGDTMASHGGWTEATNYAGTRKEYVDVRSNQSITNAASAATFVINTAGTIGGGCLTNLSTGSDILMAAATLTGGDRAVVDTDTINLTYTYSAADDGA